MIKLNDKQKGQIMTLIEKSKEKEYALSNDIVVEAVKDWTGGIKNSQDAYNKIYKKVVKNENHLVKRYANMNEKKSLQTIAELFIDDLIKMEDFQELDSEIRQEVLQIAGIKSK